MLIGIYFEVEFFSIIFCNIDIKSSKVWIDTVLELDIVQRIYVYPLHVDISVCTKMYLYFSFFPIMNPPVYSTYDWLFFYPHLPCFELRCHKEFFGIMLLHIGHGISIDLICQCFFIT